MTLSFCRLGLAQAGWWAVSHQQFVSAHRRQFSGSCAPHPGPTSPGHSSVTLEFSAIKALCLQALSVAATDLLPAWVSVFTATEPRQLAATLSKASLTRRPITYSTCLSPRLSRTSLLLACLAWQSLLSVLQFSDIHILVSTPAFGLPSRPLVLGQCNFFLSLVNLSPSLTPPSPGPQVPFSFLFSFLPSFQPLGLN